MPEVLNVIYIVESTVRGYFYWYISITGLVLLTCITDTFRDSCFVPKILKEQTVQRLPHQSQSLYHDEYIRPENAKYPNALWKSQRSAKILDEI